MPKRRQTRSVSDIPIYDRCRDRSEERSWPWPQILCKHSTTDSGTIQLNDSFPVRETPLGGVMFIEVTSRMVGDVLVVDISGELSRRASSLSNPMKELLAHDRSNLILNLSALTYVDSSGLGQLIAVWTSIRNRGGKLIVLRPSPQVRKQFEITKLDTVFTIVTDEAEAISLIQKLVSGRLVDL